MYFPFKGPLSSEGLKRHIFKLYIYKKMVIWKCYQWIYNNADNLFLLSIRKLTLLPTHWRNFIKNIQHEIII